MYRVERIEDPQQPGAVLYQGNFSEQAKDHFDKAIPGASQVTLKVWREKKWATVYLFKCYRKL